MPEVDAFYLVDYLFDVGPTMHSGMGEVFLSSTEILAWQQLSGIDLQPWEFNAIRKMSSAYLIESQQAENYDRLCPWEDAPYRDNHIKKSAILARESLRNLSKL